MNNLNEGRIQKMPLSNINGASGKPFNVYGNCADRNTSCSQCLKDSICGWCGNKCVEGNSSGPFYINANSCLEDDANQTAKKSSASSKTGKVKRWRHLDSLEYSTCSPSLASSNAFYFDAAEEASFNIDHTNTTSGNETASKKFPTKRINNYHIPVYLGAEDVGSNMHWIGRKGSRILTYNIGQHMCNGFAATPKECEREIVRLQAKYGKDLWLHAPLERSGYCCRGWSWNLLHRGRNHVDAPKNR